nr:retrovirus-related Pol polyprotein from transposon TNT 1-94 [Tanacetum cinerariifolium]
MFRVDRIEDRETMHGVQVQLIMGELRIELGRQDNIVDEDVDEQPVHDLALNVENVFQADDCDAFNFDVDKALLHRLCSWQIYHLQIMLMMKPVRLMIWTFYL